MVKSDDQSATIKVFIAPNDEEKNELIRTHCIDANDLEAALDPDEISRIEFTPKTISIIWKQPYSYYFNLKSQFDVLSVGFFITRDMMVVIMGKDNLPFSDKAFEKINSINDVILRYFFYTSRQFLGHLKTIKQVTTRLEGKLSTSLENKYFLQMFDISESLVYYVDAIEANGAVLAKLRTHLDKLNFSQRQIHYLEDILHENAQSARQANIYSSVLSGLMDARGNIINNNVNVLLRNLTMLNVIFLPLNLIASMGGMSEFSSFLQNNGINIDIGYLFFSAFMVGLGWVMWISLKRYIGTNGNTDVEDATNS